MLFAGVKGPVRDVLERAGGVERVGPESFFYEVHQAMDAADRWCEPPAAGEGARAPVSPVPFALA